MFDSDVFHRSATATDEISPSLYNFIIGAVLMWGFALTAIVQSHFHDLNFGWPLMIGYLACSFAGVMLSRSKSPLLSLLGYHLVVVPTGVFLGPFVNALSPSVLQNALFLTGGVTFGMMAAGTFFPRFFAGLGRILFVSLICLLVMGLLEMFLFKRSFTIVDWIAAGIFSLYIAYDYSRAQLIPKTMDNAVDVCIALYLDIINLFIRIASLLSRRN